MISERAKQQFILDLKFYGVKYEDIDDDGKKHWINSKDIITNQQMRGMCSNHFGEDYDSMTPPGRRKFANSIFDAFKEEL